MEIVPKKQKSQANLIEHQQLTLISAKTILKQK